MFDISRNYYKYGIAYDDIKLKVHENLRYDTTLYRAEKECIYMMFKEQLRLEQAEMALPIPIPLEEEAPRARMPLYC